MSASLSHAKEILALWSRSTTQLLFPTRKTWQVLIESKFQLLLVSLHLCPWGKETVEVTGSVCGLGGQ